jgi:CheY-like chemotaxis protein
MTKRELREKVNRLEGIKILLTEDKEINQWIVLSLLEESGIEVDIAKNGKEAVSKYNKSDYLLILMDIEMPIMNGYEATKIIRKEDREIPIIALTANGTELDRQKTQRVGMNDHLQKPIEVELFYKTFLKYIDAA